MPNQSLEYGRDRLLNIGGEKCNGIGSDERLLIREALYGPRKKKDEQSPTAAEAEE